MQNSQVIGQSARLDRGPAQQVQGKAGRGLAADTGQTGEIPDELFEGRRDNLHDGPVRS